MIYVLTFAGAAIAAVVAAVRYLRLPQEYVWWTAALMAVVVLIAGIVTFINFLRAKKAAVDKANPKASQEQLDFDNRLRDVAATLKHVERHQRATASARPRFVSARVDTPYVAVLGLQGQGKTRLLGGPHPKRLPEYDHNGPVKGADASAAPEDRPRLFSAPGQAVFVEVPHALAHREDLRKSWLAELKLFAKRRQPLHAIVLCVAADDLVTAADPVARAGEIGDLLAAEVSDLVTHLQVHAPVFLVVTRLDRLSGFGDVLGAFETLTSPLGFELPDGRSEELALKELRSRFDALSGWLDRRALRLLSRFREPDPPRQGRIYTLVQQIAGLQEPLAAIAQRVLAARGGDPVRLRGVFLTSAMQDGEPVVDAVLENLARKTRGNFTPAAADPTPSKRIFAEELVGTHVLRAGGLARRTTRTLQRSAVKRIVAGSALGLVGLYIALDAAGAAGRNRDLNQQTADAGAAAAAELSGRRRVPVESGKIVPLRELLARWEDESGDDRDDVREWGLFRGEVVPPLRAFYKDAMFAGVTSTLRDKAEAELRDFAARFESPELIPDIEDRIRNRLSLRFYLLVTGNKKSYEMQPITQESKFLRETLRTRWSGSSRTQVGTAEYGAIERAVDKYIDLAQDSDFTLPREPTLVEQVQEILKREDSVRAEVEKIVEEVNGIQELSKINLRTLTGLPDLENDGTEVRAAFTIEGWGYVKRELASALEADSWVLGLDQSQASQRQRRRGAEMRTEYFKMYTEEWRRFIQRTRIAPPTSLDEGKRLMGELVKGPRLPLSRVFAELKRHTEIADDYDYGDNKSLIDLLKKQDKNSGGLVKADAVRKEFARLVIFGVAPEGKEGSTGLDQYHERLKQLRDAIGKALEDKEEEKALVEQLRGAIDFTKSLVQDAELDTWTAGTTKLLVTPLEELLRMLVRDQGTGAVADWCARIVEPMYERFDGRYPFVADSRSDAAVADFEEFFHPENGFIRKAREELLSGYVVLEGNTVELRDRGRNDGPKLDSGVIRFLNRAQDIGSVMFYNEELRVDFELILACNPQVSKVEVTIEGKKVDFSCSNEKPSALRWPGKEEHGASLKAYGRQGNKVLGSAGEWGLFELLEKPPSSVPEFKGDEVISFRFDMTSFNLGLLDVRLRPRRVRGGTAFFGLPNGNKQFLSLVRAADVLPPKRLFTNMAPCGGV
ncbi:type VI secretion protein IcmF/TssM N-terminal domain-containing protein [Nannocystis punicea]|uniref:Type VI secretion system protein ImpL n=1 Tax=Nannocystis punicea TaxID=2995304 RepID=A0ABY7HJQ1_9BACT|nr:type VI secretion protein IcmF/TssM N-terminal domain-containing protein [Nannocystis poenicansa]WAS99583.1 hypothetical protein O0S08_06770 [Nannocystis poenicansa]